MEESAAAAVGVVPLPPTALASMAQACWHCDAVRVEAELVRCLRCRHAWFCSAACQRAARPQHRPSCTVVRSVEPHLDLLTSNEGDDASDLLTQLTGGGDPHAAWKRRAHAIQAAIASLGDSLSYAERCAAMDALLLSAKCCVCFEARGDASSKDSDVKLVCVGCRSCFACSKHREEAGAMHTSEQCVGFRHIARLQAFRRDWSRQRCGAPFFYCPSGEAEPMPERLLEACFPVYFEWRLPRPVWEQLRSAAAEKGETSPTGCSYFEDAATSGLTLPLTLTQGLRHFDMHSRAAVTVHVLGVTDQDHEEDPGYMWEECLHVLATHGLLKLDIVLIGPVIRKNAAGRASDGSEWSEVRSCPDCSGKNRMVRISYYSGLYPDFVESRGAQFTAPDIAIACNREFQAAKHIAEWRHAVKILLDRSVPSILTSSTAIEASNAEFAIRKLGAHITVSARPNPWRSLEPGFDPLLPNACTYRNHSYICVRGRASDLATSSGVEVDILDCT
jgi:hypothetical protein